MPRLFPEAPPTKSDRLLAHVRGFAGYSEHTRLENCPFLLGFLKMSLPERSKV